jgi:hypothetical protein
LNVEQNSEARGFEKRNADDTDQSRDEEDPTEQMLGLIPALILPSIRVIRVPLD